MLSWTYKDIETFLLSNRLLCLRHASQLKKIVSFLDHDVLVQLEEMLDPFTVSLMTVKQLKSAFASSQAVERLSNASPLSSNVINYNTIIVTNYNFLIEVKNISILDSLIAIVVIILLLFYFFAIEILNESLYK